MSREDRPTSPSTAPSSTPLEQRLARALGRARLAALIEELWRRLVPIAWVGGLHVALAWLGVYAALPVYGRFLLLGLVVLLLVAAIGAAWRDRGGVSSAFDEGRAIRRVEAASGLGSHEVSGLTDRPAGAVDPATAALWAAHRARLAARIGTIDFGAPRPDLGRRDRFALRPLLAMALFVGWFAAGDERLSRLAAPFRSLPPAAPEDRLDAWIDPPAYTGRSPVVLVAEGRSGGGGTSAPAAVPQGSRLVVRAASGRVGLAPRPVGLTVTPAGGAAQEIAPVAAAEGAPADAPVDRVATLAADGEVRLTRDGAVIGSWRITVIPDRPPTIRLVGAPEVQGSGATKLVHETADDWGVTAAEARFEPIVPPRGRPLFTAPSFPLSLPLGRAHTGTATTIRDVTNHPFAGSRMRLTLVVHDAAGQEGASEPIEMLLAERPFRRPLARALVELRRRLALDAAEAPVVVTALDALSLAPERFEETPATHLGLRFLRQQAGAARDDAQLRDLVELLWVAATTIEDGDLADQEKALRQAQEALRKAIEEGASPEEIARLTRELRAAMEKFLAAKAEQGRRAPQRNAERLGPQKTISERDLQRMLDRIEQLARTGSREAAEKLLQELREMMENLQAGSSSGEGGDSAGGEALEKLGDMIRRQQKLMEETHRADRGEAGSGGEAMGKVGEGQRELRDALKQFSEEMSGRGGASGEGRGPGKGGKGTPGGDGADELGEAADAMGEAGEALGRGEGEAALEAQTRALENLRDGARRLADQMMRRGSGRAGADGSEEDPAGRPYRGRGSGLSDKVRIPDEIDVERARRILDDIRKRLGEPARPKVEHDYLDRLLDLDR